jgi:ABC-type protease/lipase transport system fused ATPase/permease subunit
MSWLREIWHRGGSTLVAENENAPSCAAQARVAVLEGVRLASQVRALATGAALAASIDASPAVLVSIYDYARSYDDNPRRSA